MKGLRCPGRPGWRAGVRQVDSGGVQFGMRSVWLGALLVSTACASAPIKKPDQVALDQADALVRLGCYDCLQDARATYARVAVGKARPLVLGRLFEVELLLTLREKELAMDSKAALDRARALAGELPAALEPQDRKSVV